MNATGSKASFLQKCIVFANDVEYEHLAYIQFGELMKRVSPVEHTFDFVYALLYPIAKRNLGEEFLRNISAEIPMPIDAPGFKRAKGMCKQNMGRVKKDDFEFTDLGDPSIPEIPTQMHMLITETSDCFIFFKFLSVVVQTILLDRTDVTCNVISKCSVGAYTNVMKNTFADLMRSGNVDKASVTADNRRRMYINDGEYERCFEGTLDCDFKIVILFCQRHLGWFLPHLTRMWRSGSEVVDWFSGSLEQPKLIHHVQFILMRFVYHHHGHTRDLIAYLKNSPMHVRAMYVANCILDDRSDAFLPYFKSLESFMKWPRKRSNMIVYSRFPMYDEQLTSDMRQIVMAKQSSCTGEHAICSISQTDDVIKTRLVMKTDYEYASSIEDNKYIYDVAQGINYFLPESHKVENSSLIVFKHDSMMGTCIANERSFAKFELDEFFCPTWFMVVGPRPIDLTVMSTVHDIGTEMRRQFGNVAVTSFMPYFGECIGNMKLNERRRLFHVDQRKWMLNVLVLFLVRYEVTGAIWFDCHEKNLVYREVKYAQSMKLKNSDVSFHCRPGDFVIGAIDHIDNTNSRGGDINQHLAFNALKRTLKIILQTSHDIDSIEKVYDMCTKLHDELRDCLFCKAPEDTQRSHTFYKELNLKGNDTEPVSDVDSNVDTEPVSDSDRQDKMVTALFLGGVGAGKTVVFNKITGTLHETASGGASVTQRAVEGYAENIPTFMVVDTPGTSSFGKSQKLRHAETLRDALTKRNYNQIFVFTRFGRDGAIIEDLKKQLMIINDYLNLVTVVVTHFDMAEHPEDNRASIEQAVRTVFNVDRVLFVGKETPADQIVHEFYDAASGTPSTTLVIPARTFKLFFDLKDVNGAVFMESSKSRDAFSAQVEMYKRMAMTLSDRSSTEEKRAKLQHAYDELVQHAKQLCLDFGKHFDTEHDVDYREYTSHKEDLDAMIQDARQTFENVLGQSLTNSR
jgi:hypothetical protein